MKNREKLISIQNQLPENPGCYIFYNNQKEIIYVGKAKNLKKRVSSYFKKVHNFKTIQLVNEINDLKFITTNNEKEALLLESNLIKENRPRYNILLNDDKKYPYIVITKEKDPQIKLARNKLRNYQYQFGPFPDGTKANEILKMVKRFYPLRNCKGNIGKPCLNYQINQCSGACFKEVEKTFYKFNIIKIKKFFEGKTKVIKLELDKKMIQYAANFQYEEAQKIKNIIEKLDFFSEKQYTNISRTKNIDYINIIIQDAYLIICIYFYRNGKLLSKDYKIFEYFGTDINDVVRVYLEQIYEKNILPNLIILPHNINILEFTEFETQIINAKNKEDKNILKEIEEDAKNFLVYNLQNENNTIGKEIFLIKKLQELVQLKNIPFTFEIYDISNIMNKAQTAGVIVYKNGLPLYKEFRHYNLSDELTSDYARMKELVNLRYKAKNKNIPNLIIADGGIIQINAIRKAMPKEKLYENIEIIGLVKNKKHLTSHIIKENKKEIKINDSTLYNYLAKVQDKVHNFAISHHKKLLKKELFNK